MKSFLQNRIFPGNDKEAAARSLYESILLQSRQPAFYRDWGVPDSVDGRFELLLLHCVLAMRRLRREGEATAELTQTLFDTLIYDLDQSLRVSGVGDLKVGRKLKAMGEAFYGRYKAYDDALESADEAELPAAVRRNLYGTVKEQPEVGIQALAAYIRRESAALERQDSDALRGGTIVFDSPTDAAAWDSA